MECWVGIVGDSLEGPLGEEAVPSLAWDGKAEADEEEVKPA